VGLVRKSKLDFNFVAAIAFGLLKEQVQPTGARLVPFFIFKDQVAEAQDGRILGYARLHPAFIQIWMVLQEYSFELDVPGHGAHPQSGSMNKISEYTL
jgi:hypothetical protein